MFVYCIRCYAGPRFLSLHSKKITGKIFWLSFIDKVRRIRNTFKNSTDECVPQKGSHSRLFPYIQLLKVLKLFYLIWPTFLVDGLRHFPLMNN